MPFNPSLQQTYQTLPETFYYPVTAAKAPNPQLLLLNTDLAANLGLTIDVMETEELAQWFSGQHLPETLQPIAQAYAGHQFGHLAILGDGRALLLGEWQTATDELVDIQLKGSGKTPYSRGGDGKAALAPMLREYLISEAMFALGIPTTRSLAIVTTGEIVRRMGAKHGAILVRTAASHIRVGTFVYAAIVAKQQGENTSLQALLDYTIKRHYPELAATENPALALLKCVGQRQIALVNHWLRVGFVHGVMNTDNVCISGETIDYGPCAFMNAYHEKTVFSSIDQSGRYAYGHQSPIILWNLARFAESLLPLIDSDSKTAIDLAGTVLNDLAKQQQAAKQTMLAAKLGFSPNDSNPNSESSLNVAPDLINDLVDNLLAQMQNHAMDFTNTFVSLTALVRHLSHSVGAANLSTKSAAQSTVPITAKTIAEWFSGEAYQQAAYAELGLNTPKLVNWCERWLAVLQHSFRTTDGWQTALTTMQQNNPAVIPRNHQVETALAAAEKGNIQLFEDLLQVLENPYEHFNSGKNKHTISRYQRPPTAAEDENYQTFCGT